MRPNQVVESWACFDSRMASKSFLEGHMGMSCLRALLLSSDTERQAEATTGVQPLKRHPDIK